MKHILLACLLVGRLIAQSQTVIWTEDFENNCTANCSGNGVDTGNGPWVLVDNSPTLDACGFPTAPNTFYVSCAENGNAAGACGTGCGTDESLHVGSTTLGDLGASYDAGGWCAFGLGGFGSGTETNMIIESPTINLSGQTNMTLSFNYIEFGDGTNDDATLWYFDGAIWSLLDPLAKTQCCNGSGSPVACNGSQQGYWTSFSIALPPSANNNANVKIGFQWVNNDDGAGGDPAFAVDDIEILIPSTGNPIADFSASLTSICEGDCINFTDLSTSSAGGITGWDWDFAGGSTNVSGVQNPTNVCFAAAGTYTVTLTVTDPNGTDDEVKTGYITVSALADATITNPGGFCDTDGPTQLFAADPGGTWTATCGACISSGGLFNPSAAGQGTYTVTYTIAGTCGDTDTETITVNNCAQPTASFSASSTSICEGDCISFTDLSTGVNISSWSWSFPGAATASSTVQNPAGICYNTAGTYGVTLTVTDANGTDDTTITNYITVTTCAEPIADFTSSSAGACVGGCITFTDASSGATTWVWNFGLGASPATSNLQNPGVVCFGSFGTNNVQLIVSNAFGSDTIVYPITISTPPTVDAGVDVAINLGSSATLTATASTGGGFYSWSPSTDLSDPNAQTTTASPFVTTVYVVTFDDGTGCSATDTVIVEVVNEEAIGVPQAFSPNGDNRNDQLFVRGSGIEQMHFRIYNRYGQLVFETRDIAVGWDGTHNGAEVNQGVFTWVLTYNFFGKEEEVISGNVTLFR